MTEDAVKRLRHGFNLQLLDWLLETPEQPRSDLNRALSMAKARKMRKTAVDKTRHGVCEANGTRLDALEAKEEPNGA